LGKTKKTRRVRLKKYFAKNQTNVNYNFYFNHYLKNIFNGAQKTKVLSGFPWVASVTN